MSRVFISKDPEDLQEGLHFLLQNGILEARSLIEFKGQSFECPTNYDILFIASIHAASFFLSKCHTTALIACAGVETAKKVAERYQKKIDFIAHQSGLPIEEAERFNIWRDGRTVCFPSSQLSLGTYSKHIPENEKIIMPVYQTQFKSLIIPEKDIYIFTSPSNVSAFFNNNQIPSNAKVVAWGRSTEQKLLEYQISVTQVLKGQQQKELLTWLSKYL